MNTVYTCSCNKQPKIYAHFLIEGIKSKTSLGKTALIVSLVSSYSILSNKTYLSGDLCC